MAFNIYKSKELIDETKSKTLLSVSGEHVLNKHIGEIGYSNLNDTEKNEVNDFSLESAIGSTDTIKESSGLFDSDTINSNRFSRFARVPILDPYNTSLASREFLFFTKPDLHIYKNSNFKTSDGLYDPLKNSDFFLDAVYRNPKSLILLQQTLGLTTDYEYNSIVNNKFNSLLTNMVNSQLEFPDITASETQNNTNLFNITTTYRDGSEVSDTNYEFSLEFRDTKYLDVYMWFKAYDEYCREEYKQTIIPAKATYIDDMINYKEFSIFKIIVDDTFNIIYYGKATGVYPTNVPRSSLLANDQDIRFTVNFKAQFVQDMRPYILDEINNLTAKSCNKNYSKIKSAIDNVETRSNVLIPMYDATNNVANTEWGAFPFIIKDDVTNRYRLEWLSNKIKNI